MKATTLKRWKRDALEDFFDGRVDKQSALRNARRLAKLISDLELFTHLVEEEDSTFKRISMPLE